MEKFFEKITKPLTLAAGALFAVTAVCDKGDITSSQDKTPEGKNLAIEAVVNGVKQKLNLDVIPNASSGTQFDERIAGLENETGKEKDIVVIVNGKEKEIVVMVNREKTPPMVKDNNDGTETVLLDKVPLPLVYNGEGHFPNVPDDNNLGKDNAEIKRYTVTVFEPTRQAND